jgi:hypothetical protein
MLSLGHFRSTAARAFAASAIVGPPSIPHPEISSGTAGHENIRGLDGDGTVHSEPRRYSVCSQCLWLHEAKPEVAKRRWRLRLEPGSGLLLDRGNTTKAGASSHPNGLDTSAHIIVEQARMNLRHDW